MREIYVCDVKVNDIHIHIFTSKLFGGSPIRANHPGDRQSMVAVEMAVSSRGCIGKVVSRGLVVRVVVGRPSVWGRGFAGDPVALHKFCEGRVLFPIVVS